MTVQAVIFDVGETLVDETRRWGDWADWLGVPRLTFFAAFGAVIERGLDFRRAVDLVRPGLDYAAVKAERQAAGAVEHFTAEDFYPDALPCLRVLRERGMVVGIAGNQPEWCIPLVHEMGLGVDLIGSSAAWGVDKPHPGFFARIAAELDLPPAVIAYVGDRIDNDVVPAADAGMVAVFLRRGPWGVVQDGMPGTDRATHRIDSLHDLPEMLGLRRAGHPARRIDDER